MVVVTDEKHESEEEYFSTDNDEIGELEEESCDESDSSQIDSTTEEETDESQDEQGCNNNAKKKKKKKKKKTTKKPKEDGISEPLTTETGGVTGEETGEDDDDDDDDDRGTSPESGNSTATTQSRSTTGTGAEPKKKSKKRKKKKKKGTDRSGKLSPESDGHLSDGQQSDGYRSNASKSSKGSKRIKKGRKGRRNVHDEAESRLKEPPKKKEGLFTSADFFKKCIDHFRNHPDNIPTPNLNQTMALVCGDGNATSKMENSLKNGQPFVNPNFSEIVGQRLPSRFQGLPETKEEENDQQDKKDNKEKKEDPRLIQLIYQTALDLYLLGSSDSFSGFLKNIYRKHAEKLLECEPTLPPNIEKKWKKKHITARLSATLTTSNTTRFTEACQYDFSDLSEDLVKFVEKAYNEKVGNCYKHRPRMGIRVLYHSFLVPEIEDLQEPFITSDTSDKRLRKVELACHCRINVTGETPPGAPAGYLLVEVYYDFIYGNHQGAMDMIQRLLFGAPQTARIPNRTYRTVLCYPSSETLVFQDLSWMQSISLRKSDNDQNLQHLFLLDGQNSHTYNQHLAS
jgi:hypothetical protein